MATEAARTSSATPTASSVANPRGRQGQIDRAALAELASARIGPSLEKIDVVALIGQQDRHSGARQPAADHREVSGVLPGGGPGRHGQSGISAIVERRASMACQTSTRVL